MSDFSFIAHPHSELIAHVDPQDSSRTETLSEHVERTSQRARQFGERFGCPQLAGALACTHDFGKAAVAVQEYLRKAAGECSEASDDDDTAQPPPTSKPRGPDHSTAGAQFLARACPGLGHLLAYAIAGHHSGMPDGIAASNGALGKRLGKALPDWEQPARSSLPRSLFDIDWNALGLEARPFVEPHDGYALAFWVRMLFSCLVDADFLATEEFMDTDRQIARDGHAKPVLSELKSKLDTYVAGLRKKAEENGTASSPVNLVREEVRTDCETAATAPGGLFTLTVPTGGGKTLASMAFALQHAIAHGLDRVVYVIPYTSIIEQNAAVFRNVFGDDAVLEHHGQVDWDSGNSRLRLLAENWDAPIVVTTSVQFFESLHGNRPSACRKLHNLAKSVIVLDEAQSLPVDLLQPCLRALDELVQRYKTSVVLCTATQPAVLAGQLSKGGLTGGPNGCREIIPPTRNLHNRLRRVIATRIPGKKSDAELLDLVEPRLSALIIVNTRRRARDLFLAAKQRFPKTPVFHLSAQMCPAHRTDILHLVKGLLAFQKPCLLISTQLIEAGVDIDFPCVFREIAGMDSLAQAAGRCNREGRLPENGRVFFFESNQPSALTGFLRTAADKGNEVLALPEFADDPLDPVAVMRYFELLYKMHETRLDRLSVLSDLIPPAFPGNKPEDFLVYKFRKLGQSFHLIDEPSTPVFVPYGPKGRDLCEALRKAYAIGDRRAIVRKMQRYSVGLRNSAPLNRDGHPIAQLVHDIYWVLTNPAVNYDSDFGIVLEDKNEFLSI